MTDSGVLCDINVVSDFSGRYRHPRGQDMRRTKYTQRCRRQMFWQQLASGHWSRQPWSTGACDVPPPHRLPRVYFFSVHFTAAQSDRLCAVSSSSIRLHLMEGYSLRILQYCVAAIKFTDTQLKALNACWNMAFRKILVFIDGCQSKRSYVALGVLILNTYMLLDVLNSGRVCTLAPTMCWEWCSVVLQTVKILISYVIFMVCP